MKELDCFVSTLPGPCSAQAMESQQSDGLHGYYVRINYQLVRAWSESRIAKGSRNNANANLLCTDRSRGT